MLSRTLTLTTITTITLIAAPALAQEDGTTSPGSSAPFIGLGVEVDNVLQNTVNLVTNQNNIALRTEDDYTLYIPINLTPQLRIEPIVSFLRTSSTEVNRNNDNTIVNTENDANTTIGIGVGGFYMWSLTDSITAYGGGRLQYLRSSSFSEDIVEVQGQPTNTTSLTISRNNFSLQGAIGTEWYFTRYMSIGGEGQLNFFFQGTPTIERDSDVNDPDDTLTTNTISPNVELFFRFYFM